MVRDDVCLIDGYNARDDNARTAYLVRHRAIRDVAVNVDKLLAVRGLKMPGRGSIGPHFPAL